MKYAWSKANVLLELLLNPSSPGTLFKDHLLVHFILAKGVDRNQVRSRKTERFRTPPPGLQFIWQPHTCCCVFCQAAQLLVLLPRAFFAAQGTDISQPDLAWHNRYTLRTYKRIVLTMGLWNIVQSGIGHASIYTQLLFLTAVSFQTHDDWGIAQVITPYWHCLSLLWKPPAVPGIPLCLYFAQGQKPKDTPVWCSGQTSTQHSKTAERRIPPRYQLLQGTES